MNTVVKFLHIQYDAAVLSVKELLKNPIASFMTVVVMAIALTLPAALFLFVNNINTVTQGWDTGEQMSVFLKPNLSDDKLKHLLSYLQHHPQVAKFDFIPKEQAFAEFKENSGFAAALEKLQENPLPPLLLISPKTHHDIAIKSLMTDLKAMPQVDAIQYDFLWMKRWHEILHFAQRAIVALSLLLSIGVLFVVGNTIRLLIQNRVEAIALNKLLGATNTQVQRPYLLTGACFGFCASIAALSIISLISSWLSKPISTLNSLYASQFVLHNFSFLQCLFIIMLSMALGITGAMLAVSYHLRQIEDQLKT